MNPETVLAFDGNFPLGNENDANFAGEFFDTGAYNDPVRRAPFDFASNIGI